MQLLLLLLLLLLTQLQVRPSSGRADYYDGQENVHGEVIVVVDKEEVTTST